MNEEQLSIQTLTAIRKSLPLNSWSKFADAIVNDRHRRQAHLAKPEPDRTWFGVLDQLRGNDFVKIPTALPLEKVAEVRAHFDAVRESPAVRFRSRP
jgi:hypothetical protein